VGEVIGLFKKAIRPFEKKKSKKRDREKYTREKKSSVEKKKGSR
jgi:hypothetical protein